MLGNIQMNNHRITGLTNPPNSDDEAVNKKYVDENILKSIKPSHTPKNVFQYLMDDVNEWSTEYNVKVRSISELAESSLILLLLLLRMEEITDSELVCKCTE